MNAQTQPQTDRFWTGDDRTGDVAQIVAPGTGQSVGRVRLASEDDVTRAARTAAVAQRAWASTPIAERAEVLFRADQLLLERRELITDIAVRESGSIWTKADSEITGSHNELRAAQALASRPEGVVYPSRSGTLSYSRRVPVGVVGLITPWNYPLALAMRVIAPALVVGNAVLLKPDHQTPIIGGELVTELFADAGLPAGLLVSLPGGPIIGEAVVASPQTSMISFTGSTAAGRNVAALASSLLKKVSLELGGNNPLVVLDDADLKSAAAAGAIGSFSHQGQICMSTGRHLVQHSVSREYVELLCAHAQSLRIGDPADPDNQIGPMINQRQVDRLAEIIERSVAMGAVIRCGGTSSGTYFEPTVLVDVTEDMPAFTEELFGPVAAVMSFDTDETALRLANHGAYGLAGSVFSSNLARGRALVQGLEAGMVHVNAPTLTDTAITPMGGHGDSGNGGAVGGDSNVDEFTRVRWFTEQGEST